ncbi:hypothetical protein FS837_000285 [Tulasnella sp. UAMH 9824]|nr:hypothetical protein FS837_000285 [Tulasnella sp. UAMH 9824]
MPVYQPFFLEAYMPHDVNFVVVCRPPMFVRLIAKSRRWDGRPAVEHYYYWNDAKGTWHEHVVGITGITDVYPDKDQPSIGWERYFQYLRSQGYTFPIALPIPPATTSFRPLSASQPKSKAFNDILFGVPKEKALGDARPRGVNGKPLAPTLEELWEQGIMPSSSPGGKLCQFSLLNSGVVAGTAPTEGFSMALGTFPTAGDILGWEATPRQAPATTPRPGNTHSRTFGSI